MSEAPSEKHLEDWIVANYKQVCEYEIYEEGGQKYYDPEMRIDFIHRIVGRQVRLPSGICDLVAITKGRHSDRLCLSAIEIKKGAIKSSTIIQCLKYTRDLRHIFYHARMFRDDARFYCPDYGFIDNINGNEPPVVGMVIGHSIDDIDLVTACDAIDLLPLTYKYYGNNQYLFETPEGVGSAKRNAIYDEFSLGAIGDASIEILIDRKNDHDQRNV